MRVLKPVHYPTCNNPNIIKHGKIAEGKQRYKCCNAGCPRHNFVLKYSYRGYLSDGKQQMGEMVLNGSGICTTARVLIPILFLSATDRERKSAGKESSWSGCAKSRSLKAKQNYKELLRKQKTVSSKERVQLPYLLKSQQVESITQTASISGCNRVTLERWLGKY